MVVFQRLFSQNFHFIFYFIEIFNESDWKDPTRKSVRYQSHQPSISASHTDVMHSRGTDTLNKSSDQPDLNLSIGELQSTQMLKVNTFVRFAFSMDTLIIDLLTCKEKKGQV